MGETCWPGSGEGEAGLLGAGFSVGEGGKMFPIWARMGVVATQPHTAAIARADLRVVMSYHHDVLTYRAGPLDVREGVPPSHVDEVCGRNDLPEFVAL